MSPPDHTPQVAVDLAAPSRRSQRGRRRRLVFIIVVALTAGALLVAVTQLLLR